MHMSRRLAAAMFMSALAVSGCYVVPVVGNDGAVQYYHYPIPPAGSPPGAFAPGVVPSGAAGPVALQARLYPSNDVATQTGVVSGTVTNMMTGSGRFQLEYRGEILTGEATRVNGDARRGVASAYGSGGSYMSCQYQMSNPRQGAGACTFSNGAKYRLHIGS